METLTVDMAPQQLIRIRTHGDLRVQGWEQNNLQATAQTAESLHIEESDAEVLVQAHSGCKMKIPTGAGVQIEDVHGSAVLQDLTGELQITRVGGNLGLERLGPTSVGKVYGNLRAQDIGGLLQVGSVYGNTRIRQVRGGVDIEEQVKGNLMIGDTAGLTASALGNARLTLNPQKDENYNVEVSGNLHCRFSQECSATIRATSGARRISLDFADQPETLEEGTHRHTLGPGKAKVVLSAKGYIQLGDRSTEPDPRGSGESQVFDTSDFEQEINDMITQQMEALEHTLSEHLSNVPSAAAAGASVEDMAEQARSLSQRAATQAKSRAQAAARRAQDKLTRKLANARRRAERQARKAGRQTRRSEQRRHVETPSSSTTINEEERMLVLKMLEEKKISAQEADQLLAAMEGDEV